MAPAVQPARAAELSQLIQQDVDERWRYYEQLAKDNGPAPVQDWSRLFLVPGMAHCQGGESLDHFDMLDAIVNWVEKGKAPESMTASRVVGGRVVRTRPLCPYPQVARYTGQGSIDDAANFRCTAP